MFHLKQGKIGVIWCKFKKHSESHSWAEGARPQSRDFGDFNFILSLKCF